jgi:hypothetical protein
VNLKEDFMKKQFFLISVIFLFLINLSLFARINPFMYNITPVEIPITNNYVKEPDDFYKKLFRLPSSARIIEYFDIRYQNIDGSIETKRIKINKKIDWKKKFSINYNQPLIISCPNTKKKKIIPVKKIAKKRTTKIINHIAFRERKPKDDLNTSSHQQLKNQISVVHYVDPTREVYFDKIPEGENKDRISPKKESKKSNVLPQNKSIYAVKSLETSKSPNPKSLLSPDDESSKELETLNHPKSLKEFNPNAIVKPPSFIKNANLRKNLNFENNNNQSRTDGFSYDDFLGNGNFRTIATLGKPRFAKFETKENILRIITKDKQARHFMLIRPNRIVIDFKRKIAFSTKRFDISKTPFKGLKIGKHNDFYRVVIGLDNEYRYKLKRVTDGYEIECYK